MLRGPRWALSEPAFLGHIAHHVVLDPRDGTRLLAASAPATSARRCSGRTTAGTPGPRRRDRRRSARGERLDAQLSTRCSGSRPGHADEPGVWYAGGSPQGLFRTDDGGDTWAPVDGWNDHPMWETWAEWPEQNTPDGSMLHSVIVDPRDAATCTSGSPAAASSRPPTAAPTGSRSTPAAWRRFFPDPDPEFGHDPHCVRLHPLQPDRLYQQNHCGIYRMDRPDGRWVRIGDNMPTDVGDIGFPIELHPRDPDTAWVFPMDGTDVWPRTSPDGRPAVYVTRDAGESWTRCDAGLPERGVVHREAPGDDRRRRATRSASTSAPPAARSGRAPTRARRGAASPPTCPRSTRSKGRSAPAMKVRIPTPLRSYTAAAKVVEADGATVAEVLADLDRQFPGIRFRVVDEQGRLRTHMKVFVGNDMTATSPRRSPPTPR